jgi:hypothetical protein
VSAHLDLGKVPDYFAGIAVLIAFFTYFTQRSHQIADEKNRARREAATVAARVALENRDGQEDQNGSMVVRVWNSSSELTAFDVTLVVRHPELEDRKWHWQTLQGAETRPWDEAANYARADPMFSSFTWTLTFVDQFGERWQRTSDGSLDPLDEPR